MKQLPRERRIQLISFCALLAAAIAAAAFSINNQIGAEKGGSKGTIATQLAGKEQKLSYDRLRKLVYGKRVKEIKKATITANIGTAKLLFKDNSFLTANYPPESLDLPEILAKAGVKVEVKQGTLSSDDGAHSVILPLVILALFVGVFVWLSRRGVPGRTQEMTKMSQTEIDAPPPVSFDDIAGCDESVAEAKECLTFLQDPERFQALGAKLPAGILLHGPPGTGKTLLAKALAGEAGVPFFAASGSQFVEMYVGVGASRVRSLFARARESENGAVIFIDEIDAIGGKRGRGANAANDEREGTLNELLVQLDGFNERDRIIVVAATNRIDTLDEALLRPGRLSRQIAVPLPSESGRREILALHTADKPLAADVDLDRLAHITSGSSGADLAFIANEAAIMAARDGRDQIAEADFEEAHLRSLAGPKKVTEVDPDERQAIAYHEAGHVLCAELCETVEKAQMVTIEARSNGAGGLALWGKNDRVLLSPRFIHEKLVCALGGRAAEHVAVGTISSGASNDLQQANYLARQAIEQYGFSPRAGQLIHDPALQMSDKSREIVDQEIERLIGEAYEEAVQLLEAHRADLDSLARALLEHQTLGRPEIVKTLSQETVGKVASSPGRLGVIPRRDATPTAEKPVTPEKHSSRRRRRGLLSIGRPALVAAAEAWRRERQRSTRPASD